MVNNGPNSTLVRYLRREIRKTQPGPIDYSYL